MLQHHVRILEDDDVHELGGMARPQSGVINALGLEVKGNRDVVNFNTLDKRNVAGRGMDRG